MGNFKIHRRNGSLTDAVPSHLEEMERVLDPCRRYGGRDGGHPPAIADGRTDDRPLSDRRASAGADWMGFGTFILSAAPGVGDGHLQFLRLLSALAKAARSIVEFVGLDVGDVFINAFCNLASLAASHARTAAEKRLLRETLADLCRPKATDPAHRSTMAHVAGIVLRPRTSAPSFLSPPLQHGPLLSNPP